jgi:hypothetical protein
MDQTTGTTAALNEKVVALDEQQAQRDLLLGSGDPNGHFATPLIRGGQIQQDANIAALLESCAALLSREQKTSPAAHICSSFTACISNRRSVPAKFG